MRPLNLLLLFSVMVTFIRCSGQTNSVAPRGESPSASLFLKATINEKLWTATRVFRDPSPGSSYYLISGESNGITIGFNVYHAHMKEGDVEDFGSNLVYLMDGENSFDGGKTGKVTITKVDNVGFEGNFYFTASSTYHPKKYTVTGGSFRCPWARKK